MENSESPHNDDDDQVRINDPDLSHSCSSSSSSVSSSRSSRHSVVDEECDGLRILQTENDALVAELAALRVSYGDMEVRLAAVDERLDFVEREKEEVVRENLDLGKRVEAVLSERDTVRVEIERVRGCLEERECEFGKKIEEFEREVEGSRRRIVELENGRNERNERIRIFTESLGLAQMAKEGLMRIIECVDEDKMENGTGTEKEVAVKNGGMELDEELMAFLEVEEIAKLSNTAEVKVREYRTMWKKEKKELENSVVSLTEENRDTYSLLRIALVEKEAVEKSLNKLKGNTDQKRVAILQIAERGWQRVGFGFMMGGGGTDQSLDITAEATQAINALNRSDSSECEEDVVSLASTVEKIMKNLRLEITQLRRSLEESRSDTERLQSLTEKQAQTVTENTMYIKKLEERERLMALNVEELVTELQETEEEVARWKEACELEVEAGIPLVEEHVKLVAILQQELEKTKAALQISNSKLKLKEDLAASAMAAQAAAERSLYLADGRASEFRERIEELTKQLEEPDSRDKSRRRVRHICWPWQVLKLNQAANNTNTNARFRNQRRKMLPEMQALLH